MSDPRYLFVCVHSAPRTGSRTVRQYFNRNKLEGRITDTVHCHYLLNRRVSHYREQAWVRVKKVGILNWKIITVIRDPIARNIADFLQWTFRPLSPDQRDMSDKALIDLFMNSIDHYEGLEHPGREIEPFWGVDMYSRVPNPRLAIVRFDRLKQGVIKASEHLIGKSLGPDLLHIGRSSVDEEIRHRIVGKLSSRYVHRMLSHHYTRHFFSEQEITDMYKRYRYG